MTWSSIWSCHGLHSIECYLDAMGAMIRGSFNFFYSDMRKTLNRSAWLFQISSLREEKSRSNDVVSVFLKKGRQTLHSWQNYSANPMPLATTYLLRFFFLKGLYRKRLFLHDSDRSAAMFAFDVYVAGNPFPEHYFSSPLGPVMLNG